MPEGGYAAVTTGEWAVEGGVQLNYVLLDFARLPAVRAARSRLEQERNRYANQLRGLQLQVSEAYYQLQQREQLVRVYDANLRNDLVVLQESLDLRQADRAVARRQLAVLLNLPATITPSASDPIAVQPRWSLNLEQSLLEGLPGQSGTGGDSGHPRGPGPGESGHGRRAAAATPAPAPAGRARAAPGRGAPGRRSGR